MQKTMGLKFESTQNQVALLVKNPSANAGDVRDTGLIPVLERSPGGQQGYPLQYSCLENPMDRGDWQAIVHTVAKSRTQLSRGLSPQDSAQKLARSIDDWPPTPR